MTVQIVPHGRYQDIGRPPYYKRDISNSWSGDGVSYFSRTYGTPTSLKSGLYSFWVKEYVQNTQMGLLGNRVDASNLAQLIYNSSSNFYYYSRQSAMMEIDLLTSAVFRDMTQWRNYVFYADSTHATASERAKLYVNGVRILSFSPESYPTLNDDLQLFASGLTWLGMAQNTGGTSFINNTGIAEVIYLDGVISSDPHLLVGEFTDYGYWIPKQDISGLVYGNNGGLYEFLDSLDMGKSSVNSNHFAVVAGTPQQVTDTPTNNFPTWNPVDKRVNSSTLAAYVFNSGNRRWQFTNSVTTGSSRCSMISRIPSYWEVDITAMPGTNPEIGIYVPNRSIEDYVSNGRVGAAYWSAVGGFRTEGSLLASTSSYAQGDTLGFAYNPTTREMNLFKNGVAEAANPITLPVKWADAFSMFCYAGANAAAFQFDLNTGNPITVPSPGYSDENGRGLFKYSVPAGFFAPCTQNHLDSLDYEVVDGENAHYVAKRTGSGVQHDISTKFKTFLDNENFSVIKKTNAVGPWDAARRGGKSLNLNDSRVEQDTVDKQITFISNAIKGVRLGTNTDVNLLNAEYLDWIMNGQDPTKYGIEMILRTGNGVNTDLPHNGGQPPSMIWTKRLPASAYGWAVYHKYMDLTTPAAYYLLLNSDAAIVPNGAFWNNKAPTATQYSVGTDFTVNQDTYNYMDILFFDIPFLQSAFKFKGNQNVDGPYITLDHQSSLLFIRRHLTIQSFYVHYPNIVKYNPIKEYLAFNSSAVEVATLDRIDSCSGGIKIIVDTTGWNPNAEDMIGFSFGRFPGIVANAR